MISKRVQAIDASGIRRVFDLAAKLKDPVDLSIGQPDFDAADCVKESAKRAIGQGKNRYTVTQGIPELRAKIKQKYAALVPGSHDDIDVFVTAGVSGGLLLSYLALLDPGDEVLIPDPFFVMYRDLATILGIVPRYYDTYPDFRLSAQRLEAAITARTKVVIVNTPANPTGYACTQREVDDVVELARQKNLVLLYDEIYDIFCYDQPHAQCFGKYEKTVILNGFSKSAGVPGWRMGYVVAPRDVVSQMLKIQQYSIVCAHSASQWAMLDAMDIDTTSITADYRTKRDFIVSALADRFEFVTPSGAFYLFPVAPGGSGQQFVEKCIEANLLVVPGNVFSRKDTHFRISFSGSMKTLERGAEILNRLA
jgi:aspartate/methionine/tyrosine aminotransferase